MSRPNGDMNVDFFNLPICTKFFLNMLKLEPVSNFRLNRFLCRGALLTQTVKFSKDILVFFVFVFLNLISDAFDSLK